MRPPAVRLVDAVLGIVAAEAVVLVGLDRVTGRGVGPGALAANLLAGTFLLAGLRVGLRGGGAGSVGTALALAGLAHAADLRMRWGRI